MSDFRSANIESHLQDEPWTVLIPPGKVGMVRSLATTPGTIVYNLEGLVSPDTDPPRAFKTTDEIALLTGPGTWVLYSRKTGSSAVKETYLILYLNSLAEAQAIASLLGSAALNKVDLKEIGGTTQTGIDLMALFAAFTMAAPTSATIAASSGQAVASSSTRRYIYLRNVSTGGQRISLGFGQAAVLDDGITLEPGEWVEFSSPNGHVTAAVNAIASAAAAELAIQTGT